MTKKISVVITAAGSSSRMKGSVSKIFLNIDEKTVIEWTINSFLEISDINELIVVTKEEYFEKIGTFLKNVPFNTKLVVGGNSREESTFNGLMAVSSETDYVICHDGARPLLSKEIILNVINELDKYAAVITGVKAKDTMKIVSDSMEVVSTPDRRNLYNVQTPQAFKKDLILKAYQKFFNENFFVTDDSSVVSNLNIPVKLIEGEYSNIKITTNEDIDLVREIVKRGVY